MMSHERKRADEMKKTISQFEEEVARLRLQRDSYTDAAVQTTNEEDEVLLLYYLLTHVHRMLIIKLLYMIS